MRFRRGTIFLLFAASLLAAALVFVVLIQHRGEGRLAAATARFELAFGALDARAHAPADLPDHENAAVAIQQGTASLALTKADKSALVDFLEHDHIVPSPTVRDLLARHAEALEQYRRAGELDSSSFDIDYSAGMQAPLPMLMEVLQGKKLLQVDARVGLAEGDLERVLADSSGLAALQRALDNEPMVIFQLIAMSVEIAHHQIIQDLLSSELTTDAVLETLAGQLDNVSGTRSNTRAMQTALTVEAAWMLTAINAAATEPRAWWAVLGHIPERLSAPFEAAALIDLYYRLAGAVELPASRIQDALDTDSETTKVAGIIAHMVIPNLISALEKSRASAASRQAARLAVAVRRHALRYGAYPDGLTDFPRAATAEPYGNGAIHLELQPDGASTLLLPDAVALWRDRVAHPSRPGPRFTWHLPSPDLAEAGIGERRSTVESETY